MRSEVWLVRHAQARWGEDDYDRLSPLGLRQAEALGAVLRARLPAVDAVLTGRLRRQRETARACLGAMGLAAEPQEDAGWDEYDDLDVLLAHAPRYRDPEALAGARRAGGEAARAFGRLFGEALARWTGGGHDNDYREPWARFRARVLAALARASAGPPARRVLVFTSGGPIMVACGEVLGLDAPRTLRLGDALANASLTCLTVGRSGPRLHTFNEHGHFAGERAGLLTFR